MHENIEWPDIRSPGAKLAHEALSGCIIDDASSDPSLIVPKMREMARLDTHASDEFLGVIASLAFDRYDRLTGGRFA
jgi:hypothetical protein